MSTIRYLLDENVDPTLRTGLLNQEPDLVVWRIGDLKVPPAGTLDPEILCWCEDNEFILVTNNRKSMPNHLIDHLNEGRHVPSIFELNPRMSMGETIEELTLIWGASEAEEYQDRIVHLPVTG